MSSNDLKNIIMIYLKLSISKFEPMTSYPVLDGNLKKMHIMFVHKSLFCNKIVVDTWKFKVSQIDVWD